MIDKKYNFSYSKLATYLECPKRYELQYIKNSIEFKENIYTAFGEAVHKAIELTLNKKYDYDECMAVFEKTLKERVVLIDPREMQLIFLSEWHRKAKEIIKYFFDNFYNLVLSGEIQVISAEKYFKYEIMPNVFYSGIIDLIIKHKEQIEEIVKVPYEKTLKNGNKKIAYKKINNIKNVEKYKLVDWKTGAVKTNDNLQLLSYTVPLLLDNIFIEEVVYSFLKHKKNVKIAVNEQKIKDVKDKIISIINNIILSTENNTFDMCLDKNKCRYCNVKKYCDEEFKMLINNLNKVENTEK